jgi:hypothetical protein
MSTGSSTRCTAFAGPERLATGPLAKVALVVKAAVESGEARPVLTFDDATGRVVDLDLRGTAEAVLARLDPQEKPPGNPDAARGRGRPRLGVVPREVTLLPRHWDWLNAQPGGASVALRKLVEEARRTRDGKDGVRAAQEAAYAFMSAMAGDEPGYEEALRALFSRDFEGFHANTRAWPEAVRDHARDLAGPAFQDACGNPANSPKEGQEGNP